jgi:hypothetical protein
MRGVTVTLPEASERKLNEITMARDLALDQSRSLQARTNQLPSDAVEFHARLSPERDKHQHRWNQLHQLVSRLNQFQLRLRPDEVLVPSAPLDLRIKGSLPNAIGQTRKGIADLRMEIAKARAAPLTQAAKQDAVNRYLASLSYRFHPRVTFDLQGNAKVIWQHEEMVHSKDDVLGMLYWFAPIAVRKAFSEMLAQEPEPEDATTPEAKAELIRKFEATLYQLECQEECLITSAAADGTEVLRRPEANPFAVLQVQIVAKEAADVAA